MTDPIADYLTRLRNAIKAKGKGTREKANLTFWYFGGTSTKYGGSSDSRHPGYEPKLQCFPRVGPITARRRSLASGVRDIPRKYPVMPLIEFSRSGSLMEEL